MNSIKKVDKIAYGIGNLSYGVILQMVGTYLVFYGTVILGLPGKLIGIIVSIGTIWDAVTDPVMGYISDNTRLNKFGRRHLYLLIGAVGMAIFGLLIFTLDSNMDNSLKAILLVTYLLMIKTFSTIYATPYAALGAEMSNDYDERTSIQSYKTVFFLISMVFPTIVCMLVFFRPTAQFPKGQLNPAAYVDMGVTGAVIALLSGFICYFFTKKYIPYLPKAGEKSSKKDLKMMNIFYSFFELLKNKDYRAVVLGYMFTNIASAFVSSVGLHMFTYTYNMTNVNMSVLFGIMFFSAAVTQPLWIKISQKREKKGAVLVGTFAMMVATLLFAALLPFKSIVYEMPYIFSPVMILLGFGLGGLLLLPYSMVADTTDVGELETGQRNEGIYLGCMTFSYKISQSIAVFIFGMALDMIGFNSRLPRQTEFTSTALGLLLPIGCFVAILFAYFAFRKYSLTEKDVEEIQRKIKEISDQDPLKQQDFDEQTTITYTGSYGKNEDAFYIRREVFVNECEICYEDEFDDIDNIAYHIVVYVDGKPAATGRLFKQDGIDHIGRISTLDDYRHKGLSELVVGLLLKKAEEDKTSNMCHLAGRTYVLALYRKFGFTEKGEPFMDVNLEHYNMYVKKTDITYPQRFNELYEKAKKID